MDMQALRAANRTRQIEWTGAINNVPVLFRGAELGGEVGEVMNVAKKIYRERAGWPGSRATTIQLANELADVVICCDLLAMDLNIDLDGTPPDIYFGDTVLLANKLGAWVGKVCQGVEVMNYGSERTAKGGIQTALNNLIKTCLSLASVEGIILDAAVRDKFNATSEKVGLATRL